MDQQRRPAQFQVSYEDKLLTAIRNLERQLQASRAEIQRLQELVTRCEIKEAKETEYLAGQLTIREKHIIAHLLGGWRNREIAEKMGTTEQVVKNYLRGIYDKTGQSTRIELASLFLLSDGLRTDVEAALKEPLTRKKPRPPRVYAPSRPRRSSGPPGDTPETPAS